MFMFLPFLIAVLAALSVFYDKRKIGFALWCALIIVTLASFNYHASSPLNLSF
ncbi:DUF5993 family protein [Glaciimonas immobilis]|uniref:Uncharacterized protein n=1 Tax=Glaciimonas immobilis TaxID=728004 RepID=A0A840RU89_9BURK|nr:DUF5993 family protein [Glaciimonas immobilis]KAF3997352.1 hypothetical protein HAV38_13005 [Glaciimonas immobilis]MBB5200722.1 hypothetical protein [Glaciimonas immobilis]